MQSALRKARTPVVVHIQVRASNGCLNFTKASARIGARPVTLLAMKPSQNSRFHDGPGRGILVQSARERQEVPPE
jgi:hypothetical protein